VCLVFAEHDLFDARSQQLDTVDILDALFAETSCSGFQDRFQYLVESQVERNARESCMMVCKALHEFEQQKQ